jgi:hypothetical protein
MEKWESPVDRAIREAQERGEFDNLPGAGKPLRNLGSPDVEDPDWWVKGLVQREQLDMTGAMPPAIALRKEAATFPEALLDLRTEESVRIVLEDFNHRVKVDRLRPAVGNLPPLLARTVDVDDLVEQWRALRAQRARSAAADAARSLPVTVPAPSGAGRRDHGSWIRSLLGWS